MNNIVSLQTMLDDSNLENIQLQCLELLALQTDRYTNGESSSIKIEKAQDLLQSIYFTLEMYLKSLPDENTALQQFTHIPLAQLFKNGNEIVKHKLEEAVHLLEIARDTKVNTDNIAYNDTLGYGLQSFFHDYDADFFPCQGSGSIDYPLSMDNTKLQGVDYIHNYLQNLCFENNFCSHFSSDEINSLLRGFNNNYQEMLVNIFNLVLTNLTGRILCNKDIFHLDMEPKDKIYISSKLQLATRDELMIKLQFAAHQICNTYNISNVVFQDYIANEVLSICPRLMNSMENSTLDALFITQKHEINKPELEYIQGKTMDDELFREITDEIRQCRYVSDKAAIIKNRVTSIRDLIDIFEADCIFEEEFHYLFNTLEDMELAVLLLHQNPDLEDAELHFSKAQLDWYKRFNSFLEGLDIARKNNIMILKDKMGTI